MSFTRPQASVLSRRLRETRRFIQAVAGPRQVGKATLVTQVVEASHIAARFARDEDTRLKSPLKVVVLGSAPLLISRGLTESLAGRFELLHLPHWSYSEMHALLAGTLNSICTTVGTPDPLH
jgi:uncharacterized protein